MDTDRHPKSTGSRVRQLITLLLCGAGLTTSATAQPSMEIDSNAPIAIEMGVPWYKRDEAGCRSNARLSVAAGTAIVSGDTTGVLFWRVPTKDGRGLAMDPLPRWIRECKRAPLEFGTTLIDEARERKVLIDVGEFDRISWRWRIDRTVPNKTGGEQERLTTARLGLNIVTRAGELREIGYVWSDAAPMDSVLIHRTTHAGGMIKRDWHRIVVRHGSESAGLWVPESRDIRADFTRLFPKEDPGFVVRLYLRADGDENSPITAAFSDIVFSNDP